MDFLQCPGCLEEFTDPRQLPCGHAYCLNCLEVRTKTKGRLQCQICKASHRIPRDSVHRFAQHPEMMYLVALKKELTEKHRNSPKQQQQQRSQAGPLPSGDHEQEERKILKKLSVILNEYSYACCNFCKRTDLTEDDVVHCGPCDVAMYCSSKCYDKDRKRRHKKHCLEMQGLREHLQELHKWKYVIPKYKEKLTWLVSQHDFNRCSYCAKLAQRSKGWNYCARCTAARYCSKKCQVKDWSKHRDDCREIWKCRTFLYHDMMPEVDELTSHDINMKLFANRLMPKRHIVEVTKTPFFRSGQWGVMFDMSDILF